MMHQEEVCAWVYLQTTRRPAAGEEGCRLPAPRGRYVCVAGNGNCLVHYFADQGLASGVISTVSRMRFGGVCGGLVHEG